MLQTWETSGKLRSVGTGNEDQLHPGLVRGSRMYSTPGGSEELQGLREDTFSAPSRNSWSVALSFQESTGPGTVRPVSCVHSLAHGELSHPRRTTRRRSAVQRPTGSRRCLLRGTKPLYKIYFSGQPGIRCEVVFFEKMGPNTSDPKTHPDEKAGVGETPAASGKGSLSDPQQFRPVAGDERPIEDRALLSYHVQRPDEERVGREGPAQALGGSHHDQ